MNRNLRNRGDGVPRPGQGPDLDRPDIQFGERKMVEDGLKAVPLPRGVTPSVPPGARRGAQPASSPRGGGPPPPQAFDMPSKRPNESLATAPPMQDLSPREQILEYFVKAHSNKLAMKMLKAERGVPEADAQRLAPPPVTETPPQPTLSPFDDDEMDEGPQITDLDLSPVEEPVGEAADEEGNTEVPPAPAAPVVGEPPPEAPVE